MVFFILIDCVCNNIKNGIGNNGVALDVRSKHARSDKNGTRNTVSACVHPGAQPKKSAITVSSGTSRNANASANHGALNSK